MSSQTFKAQIAISLWVHSDIFPMLEPFTEVIEKVSSCSQKGKEKVCQWYWWQCRFQVERSEWLWLDTIVYTDRDNVTRQISYGLTGLTRLFCVKTPQSWQITHKPDLYCVWACPCQALHYVSHMWQPWMLGFRSVLFVQSKLQQQVLKHGLLLCALHQPSTWVS